MRKIVRASLENPVKRSWGETETLAIVSRLAGREDVAIVHASKLQDGMYMGDCSHRVTSKHLNSHISVSDRMPNDAAVPCNRAFLRMGSPPKGVNLLGGRFDVFRCRNLGKSATG